MMYLKHHYFEEFMTVALKWASDKKIMAFIDECRKNGVKVLPPDINKSNEEFTLVNGEILYGLASIKGIVSVDKILSARKEKPFKDFKDFIKRGHFKKNVTEALIWAGAFDSISSSRKAISLMTEQLIDNYDKIAEKEEKIQNTREIISVLNKNADSPKEVILAALKELGYKGKTVPKIDKKKKDLDNYILELESLNDMAELIEEPVMFKDDQEVNLKKEKELLGVYISGHPTQSYVPSKKCIAIDNLEEAKFTKVFGVISDLRIKQRKSDGASMAFFNLEDATGVIETCCFTKAFSQYQNLISEGTVVEIVGDVKAESVTISSSDDDDTATEEETVLKLYVKEVEPAEKKTRTIMLSLPFIADFNDLQTLIKTYEDENGCNLVLWDKSFNELRQTTIKVSDKILMNEELTTTEI